MPLEKRDAALIYDMLEAANHVAEFCRGRTFHDYESSLLIRSAVERQIEIVGEAARHVSAQTQSEHPEIPWRQIAAQRHVLAHEYGEIKSERVWRVATVHIPKLIEQLKRLVPVPPDPLR
jgi:uncharacterized protein with HEPN domain